MNRSKAITVITLAIMVGVIIGLVITSNFNIMLESTASEKPGLVEAQPASAAGEGQVSLGDLEKTSRTYVAVVKRVSSTVVTITSKQTVKVRNPLSQFFGEDFFQRFQHPDLPEQDYVRQGLGSGVIVSADGYIVTNNHVVENADELMVLIQGEEIEATIIGADPKTDLAIVKVERSGLNYIRKGDSDVLEVGEIVLAIGSPFDSRLQNTVTQGIVSAKGRKGLDIGGRNSSQALYYQDFIQTDAAINPGNSGGALVNLRGELIGINTAIIGQSNVGIGFAIPVNLAKWVMRQIIDQGHVTRGYLGVNISTPDKKLAKAFGLKEARGALVHTVSAGTPAEKAGIEEGDVIIEFDGKKISGHLDLTNMVAQYKPDSKVKVKIIRRGKEKVLTLTLAERPDEDAPISRSTPKSKENALGIRVKDLNDSVRKQLNYDEEYGVVVVEIKRNSLAAEQGLRRGDLILEYGIEREKIRDSKHFLDIVNAAKAGDVLLFRVRTQRGAAFITFEMPED